MNEVLSDSMRVLLLSRYGSLGASSRVRYLQYMPLFSLAGWEIEVVPLFRNEYIEALYSGKSRWREVALGYARRLVTLFRVGKFDVVILEKELFPFLPSAFERVMSAAGIPWVVDYDDALFHRYDCSSSRAVRLLLGGKIDSVMRYSSLVVAGNEYIADRAKNSGARSVEIVPTVVDAARYVPLKKEYGRGPLVIGWIGSPSTSRYLYDLVPSLRLVRSEVDVRFVAIGARDRDFVDTPVEVVPWKESSEVESIQSLDIGIMPLPDSPWERGKCGYKLIQYMACGLPVVGSPVGVNKNIINHGVNGFLAHDNDDWVRYLVDLVKNQEKRCSMGRAGRSLVESRYSVACQAPRLIEMIERVARS